jgi:hypothetical protein
MFWDIFCKVIDNHGDIGVCWRLSVQLASRGETVRLWVDDASALGWMAPGGEPGVQVLPWEEQIAAQPGDVVIEAFGCELEPQFEARIADQARRNGRQSAWINLEYLTAESFGERNHKLPSPLLSGPAAGLTRHFFYPGFTQRTGGLLREHDLVRRQSDFNRSAWLQAQGIGATDGVRLVSLFCYEPAALGSLLQQGAGGHARRACWSTQAAQRPRCKPWSSNSTAKRPTGMRKRCYQSRGCRCSASSTSITCYGHATSIWSAARTPWCAPYGPASRWCGTSTRSTMTRITASWRLFSNGWTLRPHCANFTGPGMAWVPSCHSRMSSLGRIAFARLASACWRSRTSSRN